MDAPAGLIISIGDVSRAGYCARGARRWFEEHKFDFRDVVKNGVTAEALLATGDANAVRVVEARLARDGLASGSSDLLITADDVRSSKKCMAGAREFAARHGIDYDRFLREGVPAAELLKSGDPDAVAVVSAAMSRARG